jgi:hypothetical protein
VDVKLRVRCVACGDVGYYPPTALRVVHFPDRTGFYQFTCAACQTHQTHYVDASDVRLLVILDGIECIEMPGRHEVKAPAITEDFVSTALSKIHSDDFVVPEWDDVGD